MRARELRGLPSTYLLTVGYDPLCSEGYEYARRLREAGVSVTHRHLPDQLHGFLTMGRFIRAAETEMKAAVSAFGDA